VSWAGIKTGNSIQSDLLTADRMDQCRACSKNNSNQSNIQFKTTRFGLLTASLTFLPQEITLGQDIPECLITEMCSLYFC